MYTQSANQTLCCEWFYSYHFSHRTKETTLSQENENKTTQTLGKGLLIIIWITSIFMVMIMNDIKSQLEQINSK